MGPQLHELSHDDCLRLLSAGGVGRIGFASPAGQQIIPVSYQLHDDAIVCRTTAYTVLGLHGPGAQAAFEVDELNVGQHTGWSVLATGTLHAVTRQAEVAAIRLGRDPEPWPDGIRQLYLKLVWRMLSGRWLGAPGPASRPSPVLGGRQVRLPPEATTPTPTRGPWRPPRW